MTKKRIWRHVAVAVAVAYCWIAGHSPLMAQLPGPHPEDPGAKEEQENEPRVFSRGIYPIESEMQKDKPPEEPVFPAYAAERPPGYQLPIGPLPDALFPGVRRVQVPLEEIKSTRAGEGWPSYMLPIGPLPDALFPGISRSKVPPADNELASGPGEPSPELLQQIAERAWQYFLANQSGETGLFDSVRGYHQATMWDVGSGLAALVAAEKLQLIDRNEFIAEAARVLEAVRHMDLYGHELPNREYNVVTLTMLDARSQPSARGSGWSSTDIGRVLIWLKIISEWYPELEPAAKQLVARWKFTRLAHDGDSFGVLYNRDHETLRQEGRLGYEQYAATGFSLWGVKLEKALGYTRTEAFQLFDTSLLRDSRSPAFLTSEPFFLARMEVGLLSPEFSQLEKAIYEVQRKRWEREGILTAMSEDSVSQEPWFVYNAINSNGVPWECVSPTGREHPELRTLSTKTAMAWWAIQKDAYSLLLFDAVKDLFHRDRGYYAGIFEAGGTNVSLNINTNAVILEAVLYRRLGRRSFLQIPRSEFTLSQQEANRMDERTDNHGNE